MSRGFTLVEALVALVVLSVGLLGAASLLLGSLRDQALALRHGAAASLVADMANRIRANPEAGPAYDSAEDTPTPEACDELNPCAPSALAAFDRAQFAHAALALLPGQRPSARIDFEPAIGPATPDRYVISLTWVDAREPDATDESTLILLAQPVAGGP